MIQLFRNTLRVLTDRERRTFMVLTCLNLLVSIADIAALACLVLLIGFYTSGNSKGFLFALRVLDKGSLMPVTIFVVLFIGKSILGYLLFQAQYSYVYKVSSRLSAESLLRYLKGDYTGYVTIDSSVHVRKILHQPIEFGHYILAGMQQVITEVILSLLALTAILIFNSKLFLLLCVVLVPPIMLIAWLTKRKLKHVRANVKVTSEKTQQHLQEALGGYIESNIYSRHSFFVNRYSVFQQRMAQYLASVQTTQGIPSRLVEIFAVVGFFALVLINKYFADSRVIDIVNIGAFMAAAYKIIPGIVKIAAISAQAKTYEYTLTGLTQDEQIARESIAVEVSAIRSAEFRNVTFSHGVAGVLSNFNIVLRAGEVIGLTGQSGRGKTTIINLLLGFLAQNGGDILINDTISTTADRQRCRADVAYVQQRPFLINDTLRNNIVLGNTPVNEQHLLDVMNMAGLNDFIRNNANGADTFITENGKNISGGQRQRIALARALYKNANLIILDEPFSELDATSEQMILKQIKLLAATGKIILLVTHNGDNLPYCNKTYTID